MNQELLETGFIVQRERRERRVAGFCPPPYLTSEGFVLFDRREGGDRRKPQARPDAANDARSQAVARDLVLERVKRLADLYGYQTAAIG